MGENCKARQRDLCCARVALACVRSSLTRCLFLFLLVTQGSCFGDVRNSVFRTPAATSVPVRPPRLQAPPAPESAKERAIEARRAAARAGKPLKPLPLVSEGVDLSAKLLPKLNAFPARAPRAKDRPLPLIEKHNRADSAVRRSSLAPSKKADMFTALMRSWFTTLQSPFHTRKPNQQHDSYTEVAKPPSDTHAPIVPARMELSKDGKQVNTAYYAPANYEAIPTSAMAAGARHGVTDLDAQAQAEGEAAQDRVRAAPFEHFDRQVLASNVPVQPRPKHFNYAGAFVRAERSSEFNSAAQEQEAELVAGAAAAEAGTAEQPALEGEAPAAEPEAEGGEHQEQQQEQPMDQTTAEAEAAAVEAIFRSERAAEAEAQAALNPPPPQQEEPAPEPMPEPQPEQAAPAPEPIAPEPIAPEPIAPEAPAAAVAPESEAASAPHPEPEVQVAASRAVPLIRVGGRSNGRQTRQTRQSRQSPRAGAGRRGARKAAAAASQAGANEELAKLEAELAAADKAAAEEAANAEATEAARLAAAAALHVET